MKHRHGRRKEAGREMTDAGMVQGQLSLTDFPPGAPELGKTGPGGIDFSCFASFRSGANGVRLGECTADHRCIECEAHIRFYEKAGEYQKAGNSWGRAVALAERFFGIPTAYGVEEYPE